MHFSKIILPFLAGLSAAAVIPSEDANAVGSPLVVRGTTKIWGGKGTNPVDLDRSKFVVRDENGASVELETRARNGAGIAIRAAVKVGVQLANELSNWGSCKKARRKFTQETTNQMWNDNPDRAYFAAAICYNKGYRVRDWNGISERVSQKLSTGLLNTDYDCMYMSDNNAFWTDGDGGYENLAYVYDGNRCSFDGKTGDLTC
ncbi:hypothetical protein IFR05_014447 [Cadophora sp. M221]|nr:hypothetical protein IFR05_014447 [Cadophora sp. M221]